MIDLTALHILIIDDDENDYLLTREMVENGGSVIAELVWARSYEEALSQLRSNRWSVCLLNNRIGNRTGIGLLQEAKNTGIAMPAVIVLTSENDRNLDEQFLDAGAADFLLKNGLTPALLERSIRYSVNEGALRKKLEQSNAELRRFAYVASHDLKEPLRTIAGFSQLLQRRYHDKLDPEANEMIDFVATAAKRLNAMISDLLNYSRLDAPTTPALVDCEEVLTYTLANLSAAIREAGADVVRGPMPALIAEPSKISQIFLNLLGNAIKFRGAGKPVIRIQAVEQPGTWLFSVEDNGIGIPLEHQERIMEIFTRVAPDYPGTGIGLTIAKKAAEQHGGQLWVKSAPGQGSTFYFTIAKGASDDSSASYRHSAG